MACPGTRLSGPRAGPAHRGRPAPARRRAGNFAFVLSLPVPLWERVVAHCLDGFPLEACGLLAGRDGHVREVYPTANAARSARIYTVEPRDLLRADRAAEAAGLSLIGVWHSHTHTAAYPSPTDIDQAPDPDWHYVLVSLSDSDPVLRSYRIVGGRAEEESVVTPG
jgi:[CysO sulfur-carrier protein]-S-L-cysteine hydrolase